MFSYGSTGNQNSIDNQIPSSNNYYFISQLFHISSYEKTSRITPGPIYQSPKFSNDYQIDSPSNLIDYSSKMNFTSPFSLLTPVRRSLTPKLTDFQQTVQQKEISEFGSSTKSNKINKITTSISIKNPKIFSNSPQKLISSNGINKVLDLKSSLLKKNNSIEASNIMPKEAKDYYSLIKANNSNIPTLNLQDSAVKSKINTIYDTYKNLERKINANQVLLNDQPNIIDIEDNNQIPGTLSCNITSCIINYIYHY